MNTQSTTLEKLLILLSLSALISCSSDSSSTSKTEVSENKITGFYYSFDESGSTIIDDSGNDFHGTASSISRTSGQVGGAIQFLVPGSSIELPIITNYFPYETGFTFRAWVKTETPITEQQQIIGGQTGSASTTTVSNIGISLINDGISFEIPAQQNTLSLSTNALSLPLDTWFHIAITYDGDMVSFYYNGDLVATDSVLTTFSPFFQNYIGNNQRIFGGIQIENQFIGYIDELYLENVIMTQSEIANYYTNTM